MAVNLDERSNDEKESKELFIEREKDNYDKLSQTILPSDSVSQFQVRTDVDASSKVKSAVRAALWNHFQEFLRMRTELRILTAADEMLSVAQTRAIYSEV
ncbi:hypothetical protein O9G_003872 [Rozella allomycis CSF55]|uniref:Uncharacterized protein n=1 Tax=Rozella allomycis (strain CSF55) TaxID=988480 RepID=A0A075B0N5_ROZAC|nr:hypothetical protein O9G_003872 [Rozella allomycis CSF55]|eukprot:EPZ35957.1 hypothetical protein O9G_003872 [Rozella allomycis CSF55]